MSYLTKDVERKIVDATQKLLKKHQRLAAARVAMAMAVLNFAVITILFAFFSEAGRDINLRLWFTLVILIVTLPLGFTQESKRVTALGRQKSEQTLTSLPISLIKLL